MEWRMLARTHAFIYSAFCLELTERTFIQLSAIFESCSEIYLFSGESSLGLHFLNYLNIVKLIKV